jgi:hypothetical protein
MYLHIAEYAVMQQRREPDMGRRWRMCKTVDCCPDTRAIARSSGIRLVGPNEAV